ncbi:type II toxin-antitoxin system VapC family toxin [uncultured Amnibacterium sp.]|uniref:type II toxin-antitoxin system VapC family toxin n=1 Tax=uncultured Amnibacterium sp. TaxID=1631851 RepID=UPI0035CA3372
MPDVIVDASALVDLLVGNELGQAVAARLLNVRLRAPAHIDSEVLSALGRMHRGGLLTARQVDAKLRSLAAAPLVRHELTDLLAGAWARRDRVRIVDALYLELAGRLGVPLITTDLRLRHEPGVETVEL